MALWIILSSIVLCCLGIYLHFWKKSNIFEQQRIPHIKPWPILGNMDPFIFQRMSLPRLISTVYNLNLKAKYVGFYEFKKPVIILRDPEIIKSIGIKNFDTFSNRRGFADETQDPMFGKEIFSLKGEKWHGIRSLLSPSFTSSKMKIMFKLISQRAQDFSIHVLKEQADQVQIRKSFQRLTADIIATCGYGISTNCIEDPKNDLYVLGLRSVNLEKLTRQKHVLSNFPLLWKILGMGFFDDEVVKFFRNIVESTIYERREKNIFRPDMLHLMMDADDKNNTEDDKKRELSIEEMTAQVFIFFFGSFHTTSGILSLLTYEMAIDTEMQKKLQGEINSVLNESNGEPSYEEINKMQFMDALIKETLRLHSVAPLLERICEHDFELPPALPGLKSFKMKPGMLLWIPVEAIHHDPDHYENPKEFDPYRFFEKDERIVLNSPKFLPFGIGPRGCIAYRLALLIFKVVIFHFFARCSVEVCSKTPIPLIMSDKTLTKVSQSEIFLRIMDRKLCEKLD